MGLGPINTTLLIWLTIIGAEAESHHAIFHHQGEVVLGNDFCHLLIDLDLNNVTQEIAELVHATETVIRIVKDDDVKPYMTGHLSLLRAAKRELEDAFSGLVLIIRTSLPSVSSVTADQHLRHHQPNLVLDDDGMTLSTLENQWNLDLPSTPEEEDQVREPRGVGLLSSIVALGTSIFGLFDLNNVAHRVNNLEDDQKHVGMMMRRQDLLTAQALNVSAENRKVILAMIKQQEDFTQDNNQMAAIQVLISSHTMLTRAVDRLATGIQMAQEGRMSPYVLDREAVATLHYQLTQRVKKAHYHLVQEDSLGLMKSPVTLIGHSAPPEGYSLPPIQLLIHVPISRTKEYTLLKYIDVPIHSQPPNTFISYQTKGYLAIERSMKSFIELDQQEVDKCSSVDTTLLCPHVKVVHTGVQPCLVALYNNQDHEKACATKVEHGTFNIKTLTPGLHLLTILEPLTLTYHYVDHTRKPQYDHCQPGSHTLQLNDSIELVSSPYFYIKGTMKRSIDVEQRLTKRTLEINLQEFNLNEDHTHSHPLVTPIDVNVSDFDVLASTARLTHDHHFMDGVSLGRGAFVTLTLLAVIASTGYLCYRCCRRRRSKQLPLSHGCCGATSSTTSTEMKAAPFHVSAPGIIDEGFRRRIYPTFHRNFPETAHATTSGMEHPPLEPQLPNSDPSNPETATQTIVPASPDFSCGQERD